MVQIQKAANVIKIFRFPHELWVKIVRGVYADVSLMKRNENVVTYV